MTWSNVGHGELSVIQWAHWYCDAIRYNPITMVKAYSFLGK